jgi:hypothetical protein
MRRKKRKKNLHQVEMSVGAKNGSEGGLEMQKIQEAQEQV